MKKSTSYHILASFILVVGLFTNTVILTGFIGLYLMLVGIWSEIEK